MAVEQSKAKYIRELLDRALELKLPEMSPEQFERAFGMTLNPGELANVTFAEILVKQLVLKACSGNDRSIQEILDRLLGKPMQTTETVSKSYSYHDFLIECRESDKPAAIKPAKQIVRIEPLPADDPFQDLL